MLDEIEENPDYAIDLPTKQMATEDIESRCQDMNLRINARCKDLLQVTRKASHGTLFPYEVDFLHRTVKDLFQVNDIRIFVASHLPEKFSSSALLCHAFLAQIKVGPINPPCIEQVRELSNLIDDLIHYAHEAETHTAQPNIILLDEVLKIAGARRFRNRSSGYEFIYKRDESVIS